MTFFYNILTHLLYGILLPVSLINRKARLWITGRKNWHKKLKQWQRGDSPVYWFHAASLGEFEQGIPIMETMKTRVPECKILLTFFSPSGYEIRKNYKNADFVSYLPLDTPYNARKFIRTASPRAVFFIKYEFWYFYLRQLKNNNIPVYLISGIFRPEQIFFRWYGAWYRNHLRAFNHLFVQDAASSDLLKEINIHNTSITGDTRFDRVSSAVRQIKEIRLAREFSGESVCIVAGSTWPADERLLATYINASPATIKFIIAPHEIHEEHMNRLVHLITKTCIRYSLATDQDITSIQVLIIDNIGMLSSLYQYAQIAYIGGGFGRGIHNLLEAAVFGIPVVFGPNHQNFREATGIIQSGAGFSVTTAGELSETIDKLIASPEFYEHASKKAKEYIATNTGATEHIMLYLTSDPVFDK